MRTVEHALAPRRVPPAVPTRGATRPRASVACVVGPVLGALALGLAWLVVHPATADLAAQEYRTGLWRREGFAIWDAQWYGGHHEPGYSLLFGPLAALLGPRALGFVAGVVAVAALTVIARRQERFPRLVGWLFAAGVMTNVLIGRVPFVLGIGLGALAWLCADARRRRPAMLALAALLALATVWASPPAGLFLALAGAARRLSGERRDTAAAICLALPPIVGGLAVAVAFPEGGRDHFAASAFWPTFALGLAGLALLDPRAPRVAPRRASGARPPRRGVRRPDVGRADGAAAARDPRPGAARARPAAGRAQGPGRRGRRRGRPAVPAVAARRARDRRGVGRPVDEELPTTPRCCGSSTASASRASAWRSRSRATTGRRRSWRPDPLARGWHRQLDEEANPLFYDRLPLTAGRYEEWLYDRAVRWVALPNVALDFSARREAALLRSGGVPGLRLVLRSDDWTIWEVLPVPPPATGPARLAGAGTDSFQLAVRQPGRIRVRATYTPVLDDRARRRLHRARQRRADGGGRAAGRDVAGRGAAVAGGGAGAGAELHGAGRGFLTVRTAQRGRPEVGGDPVCGRPRTNGGCSRDAPVRFSSAAVGARSPPAALRRNGARPRCSCSSAARGRTSSTPRATATSTGCRACSARSSATRTARRWPASPPRSCSSSRSPPSGAPRTPPPSSSPSGSPSSCPATSTTSSSRAAARSPSSRPGSSSASSTSPTASRSARRRSRATAPTTGSRSGRCRFTGVPRLQGAVRAARDPGHARREHEPVPRPADGEDEAAFCARLLAEIEEAIQAEGPDTVAMIIAEPVQNAGGCLVPPAGYWPGLRDDRRPLRDPARLRRGHLRLRAPGRVARRRALRRRCRTSPRPPRA